MNETGNVASTFALLQKYNKKMPPLAELLTAEPSRFERFSRRSGGLLMDFSRVGVDETALARLLERAHGDLKRIAVQRLQRFGGPVTLSATELLHEAVLDLVEAACDRLLTELRSRHELQQDR